MDNDKVISRQARKTALMLDHQILYQARSCGKQNFYYGLTGTPMRPLAVEVPIEKPSKLIIIKSITSPNVIDMIRSIRSL